MDVRRAPIEDAAPVAHDDAHKPRGNVAPTVDDLPPVGRVRTDATQLIDPLAASSPELLETDTDRRPVPTTDRGLPPVAPTNADLPPVEATSGQLPGVTASAGTLPPADATATSLPEVPGATDTTAPRLARAPAATSAPAPTFELTPTRVALAGLVVSVLGVVVWLVWPLLTRPATPQRVEWVDAPPATAAAAPVKPTTPTSRPLAAATSAPAADQLRLDAKVHVIDPRALHAPDLPLEPTHRYRLSLKVDDPRAGLVLARLEEKAGWGVLHEMATHHALQFGGARALRLHCEPGTDVKADTAIALELEDLARKSQRKTLTISPATQCYDFETARILDLEPGESRRVQLRSEQTAVLGQQTRLRVAYRIPVAAEPPAWRFGVLEAGDDVLVQGPGARFALLDPWVGDNQGDVVLQLLPGDTDRRGLVKPNTDAAKFVPSRP